MFIYMITANDKKYIGFDSHPVYKNKRWKTHCSHAMSGSKLQVHQEMNMAGIENCTYEILEDGFDNILELAVAEIKYIKKFDTKTNGLNSTYGGDGIGTHNLTKLSKEDLELVLTQLSNNLSDYNNDIKWAGTTAAERKHLTSHLHNDEIYKQKGDTLRETYKARPELVEQRSKSLSAYWNRIDDDTKKDRVKINKSNGMLGAKKVSKKVKIILPSGEEKLYESKSAFAKEHGYIINTILEKTAQGLTHKGYRGWVIK